MSRFRTLLPLCAVLSVVVLGAQTPSTDDMVLVPVSVVDSKGVPVTTLKEEHFQLLEDNKDQKIVYFSAAADPILVNVVMGLTSKGPVSSVGQKDRISTDVMNAVERAREANTGGPGAVTQNPMDSDGMFALVTQAIASLGKQAGTKKALVIVSDGLNPGGHVQEPTALLKVEAI